jgi:hypothetical protein
MATRRLQEDEWREYFDRFSELLGATEIELEVAGFDVGDQIEIKRAVLNGITYDPHDDAVTVFTDGFEHNIAHPREIHVDEDTRGVRSIEVLDYEGRRQIAKLKHPPAM